MFLFCVNRDMSIYFRLLQGDQLSIINIKIMIIM